MFLKAVATSLCTLLLLSSCGSSSSLSKLSTTTTGQTYHATISGWLPYWDSGAGMESFIDNAHRFEAIHPFSYEASGATKIVFQGRSSHKDRLMEVAKANNVKVIPTVSGTMKPELLKSMFSNSSQLDAHVEALCNITTENNYDGIDINYEHFAISPPEDEVPRLAGLFTDFIRQLSECLHTHGKRLEVTVMARTDDTLFARYRPKLAIGVYDYRALGAIADIVRPMAYDYSFPGGPPGSIDPIAWVEDVIEYTLANVDRQKVKIGLPTYGQDWAGKGAEVVHARNAHQLASANGTMPRRDETTESMTFQYTREGQSHHVWYDDSEATRRRFKLVESYGVSGISLWALGYEDPSYWLS